MKKSDFFFLKDIFFRLLSSFDTDIEIGINSDFVGLKSEQFKYFTEYDDDSTELIG